MDIEVWIRDVEYVSNRYIIEHIQLVGLAKIGQVFEQQLFIGEFLMKLKMIETMLEDLGVDTTIVVVAFCCLLPLEIEEQKLAVTNFFPVSTCGENFPDDTGIIASAKVVSEG